MAEEPHWSSADTPPHEMSSYDQVRTNYWDRWRESLDVLDAERRTKGDASNGLSIPFSLPAASSADLHVFSAGTGDAVLANVTSSLLTARHEILFVTCFWSASSSLRRICAALVQLSDRAQSQNPPARVRVRICISSTSLLQKLLHTQSPAGHVHPPARWHTKLGLPAASELPGLDLQVKSIFVKPFSVMHPKFVVVDRRHVLLPSCNVSWEDWLEGCLSLSGGVVEDFVHFWRAVWEGSGFSIPSSLPSTEDSPNASVSSVAHHTSSNNDVDLLLGQAIFSSTDVPAILLPHPHRVNPRFRPFPFFRAPLPPRTPLNAITLYFIERAERDIFMQTPNLTSPPVLEAIRAALRRGVDVHVVTNARLMTLEQIVTAGTTTPRCVRRLISWHRQRRESRVMGNRRKGKQSGAVDHDGGESTIGLRGLGELKVEYYVASAAPTSSSSSSTSAGRGKGQVEPVRSHLKLTVIDGQVALLGSGNMDRASWYTSQELGLAVRSREVAARLRGMLGPGEVLQGRTEEVPVDNG